MLTEIITELNEKIHRIKYYHEKVEKPVEFFETLVKDLQQVQDQWDTEKASLTNNQDDTSDAWQEGYDQGVEDTKKENET